MGQIDDGDGLQALIVDIDGEVDRPDGSTYHITWSLFRDRGRQAAESNDVIKRLGWRAIDRPVPIKLMAAMF